jgi:hypothetical protein
LGNIFLVDKYDGKRALERPRHRWKDNNEINIKQVELENLESLLLMR